MVGVRGAALCAVVGGVACGLALDVASPSGASAGPVKRPPAGFVRGVTISCPMYGEVWGRDAMREAIASVRGLGVDAVSIHPYARISRDGSVRFEPARDTGYLPRAATIVRDEKIAMLWKPHLAYWGSFEWRGAIEFRDEASWQRFFTSYEAWIVDQARFAAASDLPGFVVGTELDRTVHRPEWLRIIERVRAEYGGRITYAANWDSVERVPFWDRLDYIGVQGYYPLGRGSSPSRAEVRVAWDAHLAGLGALSKRVGRPVLFTEVGFNRSLLAAEKPWAAEMVEAKAAVPLRRMLMEVTLEALHDAPFVAGAFWWKWMPGFAPWESDFAMTDPEAQDVLRSYWR